MVTPAPATARWWTSPSSSPWRRPRPDAWVQTRISSISLPPPARLTLRRQSLGDGEAEANRASSAWIDNNAAAVSVRALSVWGTAALRNRWGILAVLFTVRLSMAFQFQSVAAVAPLLGTKFGVSLADIGLLIGLYFTPGVAIAFPGGAIGRKFGDKPAVAVGLALMLLGSLAMAASETWGWQIA